MWSLIWKNSNRRATTERPWKLRRRAPSNHPEPSSPTVEDGSCLNGQDFSYSRNDTHNGSGDDSKIRKNRKERRWWSGFRAAYHRDRKISLIVTITVFLTVYIYWKRRIARPLIDNVPLPLATSWPSVPAPLGVLDREAIEKHWEEGIPQNLWFTYRSNIFETKEPRQYYTNVINSVDKYAASFLRIPKQSATENHLDADIRVTCMNDAYCEQLIYHVKPVLAPFFLTERNGSFKGDICRVAALYKFGGYYFDVDMEVVNPYIAPFEEGKGSSNKILFTTAWDAGKRSFFQSFMAGSPGHPIISLALDLMVEYYKGEHPEWKNTVIMGPVTLEEAYRRHTGIYKPKDPRKNTEFLQSYPKEHQKHVAASSFVLEEGILRPKIHPNVPKRTTGAGDLCNLVVTNPKTFTVHFYSRIVGSSNCPFQGWKERIRRLFPHGTCGGGYVGNGRCFHPTDCCSKFGYCGVKKEYCHEKNMAKKMPMFGINFREKYKSLKQTLKDLLGLPTCGMGEVGNGRCPDPNACCSKFGWCGTGDDFCGSGQSADGSKNTNNVEDSSDSSTMCGDGKKGNGKCADPLACCSEHGWCGFGPKFCKGTVVQLLPCGGGRVGNGICPNPDACCSKFGWCGVGDDFCSTKNKAKE